MTGSIKDYTPNFNLIIPEFNITGWHDYLEENFRSIDALFYNLFGINNYKGVWTNNTVYNVGDVLFVGEDTTYSGRLIKVLVEHTTAGDGNFTQFFEENPTYYELFADASTAQIYAQLAKNWAVKTDGPVENDLYSSKYYADLVNAISTEITTLYNIRNAIQNVSIINTEVVNVSNIRNSVQNVANNSTNINTVANNVLKINNVSDNISVINEVNTNLSDIITIENNITAINSVATNITNINAVNTNKNNINSVAGNATNINNVAENITNINNVANNRTNINTVATNIANINTNATNINSINTNASNISAIQNAYSNAQSALNSKNKAQEWATSTTLVDNTDYSAKYYANKSQTSAELSAQYANDKINQTHITNCITSIPQDTKYELNSGTLRVKAGSKVYVPNGSGVFDVVNVSSDITLTQQWGENVDCLLFLYGGSILNIMPVNRCSSGTNDSISGSDHFYYNTTNNTVRFIKSSGTASGTAVSLPIAIVKMSGNGAIVSSIEQVFNGFGYIGSTIFVLPGVKGLIPNGRNDDGTLKNIELQFTQVTTSTNEYQYSGNIAITSNYFDLSSSVIYNEKENRNYVQGGSSFGRCLAGKFVKGANGIITSLTPKTAFHAVDYDEIITDLNSKADKSSFQVVSALPANPDSNTFYFIPE